MVKKKIIAILTTLLVVSLAVWAPYAPGAGGKMTIKRLDDPVTVHGKDMKNLTGKPIAKFRLLVWKEGKFVPAPYQIDERLPSGDWVFPISDPPEKDVDSGLLDDNDELAFMARDAGDEAPEGARAPGAKAGARITVRDPVDGSTGYAYLFIFDDPPEPSRADYATYKVDKEWMWMIGQSYKLATGVEESYFDKLMLKRPDGSWTPDILDRYKSRGLGIPIPGMSTIPESNAKAKAVGWIDGPVRVIRKSIGWLKIAWKIKFQSEGSSQNIYYPTFFVIPLKIKVPSLPKAMLHNFRMVVTLDFNKQVWGSAYYDAVNTAGVKLDGKMSDAEKKLDLATNRRWYCVTGPVGTVFGRYVLSAPMEKIVSTPGYYVDDINQPDPPEEEPGQSNVGLVFKNFAELPPGNYSYSAYMNFPQNFKWGEQKRILDLLDRPLTVKVEAIQ